MDVTLVLTHRCNLNCGYCYAGEHHKTDMDDALIARAVELLFSDDNRDVQLGFFGGEPLLRFDSLRHAVLLAEKRAAAEGRNLMLQVTTNGAAIRPEHVTFFAAHNVVVTISIDGIAEAHDLNRPKAGGGSSFGQVVGGLRQLLASGQSPNAMMVITPETAPYVYRSVSWLWTEGVRGVRANLALGAPWGTQERDELREQLTSVGIELAGRRMRGESVVFHPFARGMNSAGRARPARARRKQVVVGVGGNLYPCAPMVGEDRDTGPEASLRLGHVDAGPAALLETIKARGAGCSEGAKCACAAYLETGDREVAGPIGLWYGALCREIGAACAEAIARGGARPANRDRGRRPFLIGLASAAGLGVGVPLMIRAGLFAQGEGASDIEGPEIHSGGAMAIDPEPEPLPEPEPEPVREPEIQPPGGLSAPEPEREPPVAPPEPIYETDGAIAPEPFVRGDISAP